MITVTGRTFDYRDQLMRLGGWFDRSARNWRFDRLSPADVAALKALPGLIVTEPEPAPSIGRMSRDAFDRWLAETLSDDDDWKNEDRLFVGNDETYRHHFAESDPVIYWGFDSLHSFVDHVDAIPPQPEPADRAWNGDPKFSGTETFAEAVSIARNGWLDALGMASLLDSPIPLARRRTRTLAGGVVNVPRMLTGQPAHMVKRKRKPANKIITLFVETVSWKGIKHDTLLIRAIAVAAMIDHLETAGYRCNVVAVFSIYRDDRAPMQLAVQLKNASERLNITDISFAFGHPSFGRRLVLAAVSIKKAYTRTEREAIRGIVGYAFTNKHRPGKNEFYIPSVGHVNSTDIFKILDIIEPDNLPVKVKRD